MAVAELDRLHIAIARKALFVDSCNLFTDGAFALKGMKEMIDVAYLEMVINKQDDEHKSAVDVTKNFTI